MNLDKAIEILTLMGTPDFDGHTEDILTARKLGKEAIKRIKHGRRLRNYHCLKPLPGETP